MNPDRQKAIALKTMSIIPFDRLSQTDLEKYPSNTLTDYYDIVHKYMEAISLVKGYKIKGDGAHQELIDWMAKELSLNEQTRLFLQQMRDYRNRIAYEGFAVHKNYIVLNKKSILKIIEQLSSEVENLLKK